MLDKEDIFDAVRIIEDEEEIALIVYYGLYYSYLVGSDDKIEKLGLLLVIVS